MRILFNSHSLVEFQKILFNAFLPNYSMTKSVDTLMRKITVGGFRHAFVRGGFSPSSNPLLQIDRKERKHTIPYISSIESGAPFTYLFKTAKKRR